MTADKLP